MGRSGLRVSPLCLGSMMFGGATDESTAARARSTWRSAWMVNRRSSLRRRKWRRCKPPDCQVFAPVGDPLAVAIADPQPDGSATLGMISDEIDALMLRDAQPGGTLWLNRLTAAVSDAGGVESFNLVAPTANMVSASSHIPIWRQPPETFGCRPPEATNLANRLQRDANLVRPSGDLGYGEGTDGAANRRAIRVRYA